MSDTPIVYPSVPMTPSVHAPESDVVYPSVETDVVDPLLEVEVVYPPNEALLDMPSKQHRDDKASSERDHSVERFYRENPHNARRSRSSSKRRGNSSHGRQGRERHDNDSGHDYGHHPQRSQSGRGEGEGEGEQSEGLEEEGSEADSDLDDIDLNLDDSPSGLRKAMEDKYDIPMTGTVLGYRKCGPFYYQCLVRYGDDDAPTYRMIPGGSAGPWDPQNSINIVAEQRGPIRTRTDWKFKEQDILRIAGVAWKPYDEHSLTPLASLNPKNFRKTPPSTYVVVVWKKDNMTTFETRGSMRRIFGNKRSGAPDLAIYHRARVQEKKYLEARTRTQSPKKTKTFQQRRGYINDATRRFQEESEILPRDTGRMADVRKGDSRSGGSRIANSRTQYKTTESSSEGSSTRLFYDDSPTPSSSKGQPPDLKNPMTREEMMEMMFRFWQEKALSTMPTR